MVHGEELTLGGDIDVCHLYKLRNNQRPLYLYSEVPQERTFHHDLLRANVYEANAKSTSRFSHTYFQNCMREWNQLDKFACSFCVQKGTYALNEAAKKITVWFPRHRREYDY